MTMDEKTITKADLARNLAQLGISRRHAREVVDFIFAQIVRSLQQGEVIHLVGFGAFRYKQRRARTGRNPRTGAKVAVPAKRIIQFRPGGKLKNAVRKAEVA